MSYVHVCCHTPAACIEQHAKGTSLQQELDLRAAVCHALCNQTRSVARQSNDLQAVQELIWPRWRYSIGTKVGAGAVELLLRVT